MAELHKYSDRALMACSLWLHMGFIGLAAAAGGLLLWFDGGSKWPSALALALFGGVLAVASWRRGLMVLHRAKRTLAVVPDIPGESTSRAASSQIGGGTLARMSLVPPRSRRRA